MRTRPRQVVRMLAAFRHSAHCRNLRASAAAQAVRDLANEEEQDDTPDLDEPSGGETDVRLRPRKPHQGMH